MHYLFLLFLIVQIPSGFPDDWDANTLRICEEDYTTIVSKICALYLFKRPPYISSCEPIMRCGWRPGVWHNYNRSMFNVNEVFKSRKIGYPSPPDGKTGEESCDYWKRVAKEYCFRWENEQPTAECQERHPMNNRPNPIPEEETKPFCNNPMLSYRHPVKHILFLLITGSCRDSYRRK